VSPLAEREQHCKATSEKEYRRAGVDASQV
jgi:hypothetical protein